MQRNELELTKFHRLFYPQVAVVITAEFEETVGAMPAIWCMPLSFTPPLVGVAVAPDHATYRLICGARGFCLNWVEFSYANQIGDLGSISGREQANKLTTVGFATVQDARIPQPHIKEASAVLACRLERTYRMGSHDLVVGKAECASANEFFNDYWDLTKYSPPLYAGTVDGKEKSWVFMSVHGETKSVPLNRQR